MADSARFCAVCGTERRSPSGGLSRKTVTVIFSDISGFTTLAEHLDTESLSQVVERYYYEMRRVVESGGGTIGRFLGDAVMAVYGVPQLHEDDAHRAVRAATAMREAVRRLNKDLHPTMGVTIEIHTGVNTGEVFVGDPLLGDANVVGDSINVAARLQQAAAPGEILLGQATANLLGTAAEVEHLEPLSLKGKTHSVPACRLVRFDPTAGHRPSRFTAPFVGRDAELGSLLALFSEAVERRSCRTTVVVGPAGIGKSRLLAEVAVLLGLEATVLRARCQPFGELSSFSVIGDVIRAATDIDKEDGAEQAREKLLAVLDPADALATDHLLRILGLSEGTTAPEDVFWSVRKVLESLASRRPLAVLLDDLHWANPMLIAFLDHVQAWSKDAPIVMIGMARPEYLEVRSQADDAHLLTLGPMSRDESVHFVENFLRGEPVAERALGRIAEAAQGNALYLEEVLSMLLDEGLLRLQQGRWFLTPATDAIKVPPTLQALLAARVDHLPPSQRQVIEVASVVGNSFSLAALQALLPHDVGKSAESGLRWLQDREFVEEDVSSGGFRFHHSLLREAAYTSVSKEARAQIHERYAHWIGAAGDDAIVGHHLEQAYRCLVELRRLDDHARGIAEQAGERLSRAGERAFALGDMPGAAKLLTRTRDLLPPDSARCLSLLSHLSEALISTGDLQRASDVVADALEAAAAAGHRQLHARMSVIRSLLALFTDPEPGLKNARSDVADVIPLLEEEADDHGLAKAWYVVGIVELAQARFNAAEEAMWRAAAHARRAGDRRQELELLSWLPVPVWLGPRWSAEAGIGRCAEIIAMSGSDRKVQAMAILVRGALEAMRHNFEAARRDVRNARQLLEDLGLSLLIAGTSQPAGWIELLAGDPVAAEQEFRSGYAALRDMGESGLFSTVAAWLSQALQQQGRIEEAEEMARISEEAAGTGDVVSLAVARGVRATVLARRGHLDRAEDLANEAVALARSSDCPQLLGDALVGLAEVVGLAGRPSEAIPPLSEALELFRQKGNLPSTTRATTALEKLCSEAV